MVTRVTGLASGMDIDSIVDSLVKARKTKIDEMGQKKKTYEWQRDSYREVNTKLYDYRNSKLTNYRLESTFGKKSVTITGNTSAVSAKSNGSAQVGTLRVKVDKLATAASNFSISDIRSGNSSFDPSFALNSTKGSLGTLSEAATTFKINGTEISFNPEQESLNDVITKINKKTNVNAYYDINSGRVSLTAKDTGVGDITFEGEFITDILNIKAATEADTNAKAGTNASVSVNGMPASEYKSNTITISGVNVTLLESGGAESVLNVKTDTDSIVEQVKSFISDYNDLLKSLNDKLSEKRYKDYLPLTDEQKKEMTDGDIELWEEKARSGMLRNDSILSQTVSDMRLMVYSKVETGSSKYNSLASLGIKTGDYTQKGTLELEDEDKLRAAIEADPDAVVALFTGTGTEDVLGNKSGVGIAKQLYDRMQVSLNDISVKAGSLSINDSTSLDESIIGRRLYELTNRIKSESDRLDDLKEYYYTRFSTMEDAINRLNSQSQYLAQFGAS